MTRMQERLPNLSCIILFVLLTLSVLHSVHTELVVAEHQEDCRIWNYDFNGIPYYRYGNTVAIYPEGKTSPLHVAVELLHYYEDYVEGKTQALEKITKYADWLIGHAVQLGNYSVLEYDFKFLYGMEPPWHSSLVQARAVEALGKAHELTGNQTYLDAAKSLLNSFFVEVKDGGITYKTPNEGWWYEHYADDAANATHPRILNGMQSAVISLYKYYQYTNDTDAKFLFDQGILALKNTLPIYDNDGWSYYDIHEKPATMAYHLMHIKLLNDLSDITGEEIFEQFRDKWHGFMKSSNITPPRVIGVNTSDTASSSQPQSIAIKFNEFMDKESINKDTVMLMKSEDRAFCTDDDSVAGTISLNSEGKSVIFEPQETLAPNTTYKVIITKAVRDLEENTRASSDNVTSFHTAPTLEQANRFKLP